jgi:hypothetical protein
MHGIKVLMAKNYIDNLVRGSPQRNAGEGRAGHLAHGSLFEWYATGTLSLKEAADKARAAGLVYRKSGAPVPVSTVHTTASSSTGTARAPAAVPKRHFCDITFHGSMSAFGQCGH